jgi:PAS domain S-box-containing protein
MADTLTQLEALLRQRTRELRASEARYRNIINRSADGVLIVNQGGLVQFANPAAEALFGRGLAQLTGEPFGFPVTTGEAVELDIFRRNGLAIAEMRVVETEWENETAYLVSLHDITERKQTEERLRQQTELYEALLKAQSDLGEGFLIVAGQRIVFVNSAFCLISGYDVTELMALPSFYDIVLSEERTFVQELLRQQLSGRPALTDHYETTIVHKQGHRVEVEAAVKLLRLDDQPRLSIIARDITRRKQRERELEAVVTMANALRTAPSRAEMLPVILDQTLSLLKADGTALALRDPATEEIVIELGNGVWAAWTDQRLPHDAEISQQVIEIGQAYLNNNAFESLLFPQPNQKSGPVAMAGVPLIAHEQIVGALWLNRKFAIGDDELRLLIAIADIAANAIHRATLHEQRLQRLQRLAALRTIDMAITASLDLRMILRLLLDQVTDQLNVHAASVLLLSPNSQTLEYTAGRGFKTKLIERSRVQLGEGAVGMAALERRTAHIPALLEARESFGRTGLLTAEGFVEYYGVPLIAKGRVKGLLEIFHRVALSPDPEWLDFLESLASHAALAIENASLFDDLQRSNVELALAYDATIEGWSRALDLRDKETEGHTQRVTEMTVRLARAIGISESEIVHIRRGALLHDIGKMGIPDAILLKTGPLAESEWSIMRQHPMYAYKMLSPIAFLRPALDIPYCHHEKWDGAGYPRGLKGDQIPLAARVFAVVDVWDALRSGRPYRQGWERAKVIEYIGEQSGKHFDPQIVDAFMRLISGQE